MLWLFWFKMETKIYMSIYKLSLLHFVHEFVLILILNLQWIWIFKKFSKKFSWYCVLMTTCDYFCVLMITGSLRTPVSVVIVYHYWWMWNTCTVCYAHPRHVFFASDLSDIHQTNHVVYWQFQVQNDLDSILVIAFIISPILYGIIRQLHQLQPSFLKERQISVVLDG